MLEKTREFTMIKKIAVCAGLIASVSCMELVQASSIKTLPSIRVELARNTAAGIQYRAADLKDTFELMPRLTVLYVHPNHRLRTALYQEMLSYMNRMEKNAVVIEQQRKQNPLLAYDPKEVIQFIRNRSIYPLPPKEIPIQADISEFLVLSMRDQTADKLLKETPFGSGMLVVTPENPAELLNSLEINPQEVSLLLYDRGQFKKKMAIKEQELAQRFSQGRPLLDLDKFD